MEAQRMPKFSLTPVEEVQLHRAPLAKVLMQVQYSRTPQLVTDVAEAVMAETLGRYPVRRRQVTAGMAPNVVINGQQLQVPGSITPGVVLLFSDPKVAGPAVEQVPKYVIPELGALVGCVEAPLWLHHSITESQIEIGPNERMLVRSGLLPAGSSFDPALQPVGEPSWVLDMDVFTTQASFAFEPDKLTQRLRRYAETVYSFFRYATTEGFQDAHRGEPAPTAGETR